MRRKYTKSQSQVKETSFEIDHIDPLGQGVSKKDGSVTFVAGTLPGETGTAGVYKRAKGVQFARVQQLEQVAGNRTEPDCPHFNQCPGCQFLHTDYASELSYKKSTLLRQLGSLDVPEEMIEVIPAPHRLGYRNRVQLHYRHKYIGMLDAVSNEILPIPECKIIRKELQCAFDQLYQGEWAKERQGHGHCELYLKSGEVSIQWNETYAHGGFSQVNEEMNLILKDKVQEVLQDLKVERLLDMFSGTGNLSEAYAAMGGDRVLVDRYIKPVSENMHPLDLYDDQALSRFTRKSGALGFDMMLIDPPRRGFPDLNKWVKRLKPGHILYVSCNPASLAWDLRNLGMRFRFKKILLLDLFPATSHFETLVLLEIRKPSR